jgi:hypothetical protein
VRPQKARHPPNQERILEDDLLRQLFQLLDFYRGVIRITLLRNIALLTHALLTLFHGARGANGWLSQAALARCFPPERGTLFPGELMNIFHSLEVSRILWVYPFFLHSKVGDEK